MSERIVLGFKHADPKALTHLLTNIYQNPLAAAVRETMSNALDAIFRASRQPSDQTLQTIFETNDDGTVYFYVIDNGCGMDEATLQQRFLSYANSDKTTEAASVGSFGLGAKAPLAYGEHTLTVTSKKAGYPAKAYRVAIDNSHGFIATETTACNKLVYDEGTCVAFPLASEQDAAEAHTLIKTMLETLAAQGVSNFAETKQQPWLHLGNIVLDGEAAKVLWNPEDYTGSGISWRDYFKSTYGQQSTPNPDLYYVTYLAVGANVYSNRTGEAAANLNKNSLLIVCKSSQLSFTPSRESLIEDKERSKEIIEKLWRLLIKCAENESYTNDLIKRSAKRFAPTDEAAIHFCKEHAIRNYKFDPCSLKVTPTLTYSDIIKADKNTKALLFEKRNSRYRRCSSESYKFCPVKAIKLESLYYSLEPRQSSADNAFEINDEYFCQTSGLLALWISRYHAVNDHKFGSSDNPCPLYVASLDGLTIRACRQTADKLVQQESAEQAYFLLFENPTDETMKANIQTMWPDKVKFFSPSQIKSTTKKKKKPSPKTEDEMKRTVCQTLSKGRLYKKQPINTDKFNDLHCYSIAQSFSDDWSSLGVCFGRFEESASKEFSYSVDSNHKDSNADTVSRLFLTRACENIDKIIVLPKSSTTKSLAAQLKKMGITILWSTSSKIEAVFNEEDLNSLDLFVSKDREVFTDYAIEMATKYIDTCAVHNLIGQFSSVFNTGHLFSKLRGSNYLNLINILGFDLLPPNTFNHDFSQIFELSSNSSSSLLIWPVFCRSPEYSQRSEVVLCQQIVAIWGRLLKYYHIGLKVFEREDLDTAFLRLQEVGRALGFDRIINLVINKGANIDDLLPEEN